MFHVFIIILHWTAHYDRIMFNASKPGHSLKSSWVFHCYIRRCWNCQKRRQAAEPVTSDYPGTRSKPPGITSIQQPSYSTNHVSSLARSGCGFLRIASVFSSALICGVNPAVDPPRSGHDTQSSSKRCGSDRRDRAPDTCETNPAWSFGVTQTSSTFLADYQQIACQ